MDMTAFWLNHKKKQAGEGRYYYFYPYTRCEIDDTPTIIIDGKQYVRIEVSEAEFLIYPFVSLIIVFYYPLTRTIKIRLCAFFLP